MRWITLCACVLPLVVSQNSSEVEVPPPIVDAPSNGKIQGIRISSKMGRTIEAFLGVPFAQPPLGSRRFMKPEPITRQNGIYDASKARPGCLQTDMKFSEILHFENEDTTEDCLHLNIFVPKRSESSEEYDDESVPLEKEKFPVFIFLHGGIYSWGENRVAIYDGAEFTAEADVIVIIPNYRLNIFGFTNSTTKDIQGNMGIWDQVEVLKWVNKNIGAFGGDPDLVTIAGQSAGAMSASALASSPYTKGLVKRAILMSGTSLSLKFLVHDTPAGLISLLADTLNCNDLPGNYKMVAECIKKAKISYKTLTEIQSQMKQKYLYFGPGYGDAVIPYDPQELYKNKYHVDDILIGTNAREGDFFVNYFTQTFPPFRSLMGSSPEVAIRIVLRQLFKINIGGTKKLYDEYVTEEMAERLDVDELYQRSADLIGHALFDCPTEIFANHASKKGVNVYSYVNAHHVSAKYNLNLGNDPTHNDDIVFMLGTVNANVKELESYNMKIPRFLLDAQRRFSPEEHHYSRVLVRELGNFIRNGKPKIPGTNTDWPTYTKADPKVVYLAPNNFTVVVGPKTDKCKLWEPYIVSSPEKDEPEEMAPPSRPVVPSNKDTALDDNEIRRGKVLRESDGQYSSSSVLTSSAVVILIIACGLLFLH